jgi:RecA-family ATPase
MEFPPVSYVVPDIITPGLTILAGAPKLGKSWLALDIASAVEMGGYTLGDRKCQQGAVLYAALEDNPRRLQDRIRKVRNTRPGPDLTFWTEMPTLDNGGIDQLRAWIEGASQPRLIIIDVLNKVRSQPERNEAPYSYDYRSVTPLKDLADQFGIAIVVVHHVRKAGADDSLERVSGTNGLTGAADAIVILSRDGTGVTLSGRGRDIAEFEFAVEFDAQNCRWHLLGDAVEVRRSDERTAILDVLRDASEPMTSREIADVTGKGEVATRQTLSRMSQKGEVSKASRGKYTAPYLSPLSQVSQGHNGGVFEG